MLGVVDFGCESNRFPLYLFLPNFFILGIVNTLNTTSRSLDTKQNTVYVNKPKVLSLVSKLSIQKYQEQSAVLNNTDRGNRQTYPKAAEYNCSHAF